MEMADDRHRFINPDKWSLFEPHVAFLCRTFLSGHILARLPGKIPMYNLGNNEDLYVQTVDVWK